MYVLVEYLRPAKGNQTGLNPVILGCKPAGFPNQRKNPSTFLRFGFHLGAKIGALFRIGNNEGRHKIGLS